LVVKNYTCASLIEIYDIIFSSDQITNLILVYIMFTIYCEYFDYEYFEY